MSCCFMACSSEEKFFFSTLSNIPSACKLSKFLPLHLTHNPFNGHSDQTCLHVEQQIDFSDVDREFYTFLQCSTTSVVQTTRKTFPPGQHAKERGASCKLCQENFAKSVNIFLFPDTCLLKAFASLFSLLFFRAKCKMTANMFEMLFRERGLKLTCLSYILKLYLERISCNIFSRKSENKLIVWLRSKNVLQICSDDDLNLVLVHFANRGNWCEQKLVINSRNA